MRYEFEDVIIDTGGQFELIDATTLGDDKPVMLICMSQEAADAYAAEHMRDAKARA